MNKTVAIYFSKPGAMDYPFHKEEYYEAYCDLSHVLEEKGIQTYIVRGDSHIHDGQFKEGWFFDGKDLKKQSRGSGLTVSDAVYPDRTDETTGAANVGGKRKSVEKNDSVLQAIDQTGMEYRLL